MEHNYQLFSGNLFAEDFLCNGITESLDWKNLDTNKFSEIELGLQRLFENFPIEQSPNESQTRDDLIWPVLQQLGWKTNLKEQNLSSSGRRDVPDVLLFQDETIKKRANNLQEWQRYRYGLAVAELKRWGKPLDHGTEKPSEKTAPSTQMLRYLRLADDQTGGKLRYGFLTNGKKWRLYYQGARSVSEQFFEVDLSAIFNTAGNDNLILPPDFATRRHWLKVFILIFRLEAFLPNSSNGQTFHQYALGESQYYQERVTKNLSGLIFKQVFPNLANAIAKAAPNAPLSDVREATLVLLYRLLFILYAEDRNLLPIHDSRYDDYALRKRVRDDVKFRKDQKNTFSTKASQYWPVIDDLCRIIASGDASIGLPPYNGGLFDRERPSFYPTSNLMIQS